MKVFKSARNDFAFLNPYIIAEIGVNHEGSLARAQSMIRDVARAGGHAAKFQTYKADKLATKAFSPSYWDLRSESTTSQHALFQKYDQFGEAEYQALANTCEESGIDFLSTPFDIESVDMLDSLVPMFKIASADLTNVPLLRKIAATKKPILLSTGAATPEEIAAAVCLLKSSSPGPITLLHCVLNYPTPKNHAQMSQLDWLFQNYGDEHAIGYSDHVAPEPDGQMPCLELATLRGAVVIEKHFTDDQSLPGNDHYHAMDSRGLELFSKKIEDYRTLFGTPGRKLEWEEQARTNARRRIVAHRKIESGEKLCESNLIGLRANQGIEIDHWDGVIGRKTNQPISPGTPIRWEDLAE